MALKQRDGKLDLLRTVGLHGVESSRRDGEWKAECESERKRAKKDKEQLCGQAYSRFTLHWPPPYESQ